jgi:N-acetyl-beta-hexosaminidase
MSQLNVLPYPAIVDYVAPESLHVCTPAIQCDNADEGLLQKAAYLQQALQQRFGTFATICEQNSSQQAPGTAISLQLVEQLQQLQQFRWREEGYQLTCGAQGIQIAALTTTGVFYGIQTLLQALQATPEGLRLPYTQVRMHAATAKLSHPRHAVLHMQQCLQRVLGTRYKFSTS